MRHTSFLGDLLTQVFDRPMWVRGGAETRSMRALAEALLSAEGEVSGTRLAASLLAQYMAADDDEKLDFFNYLNEALEIDPDQVVSLAASYGAAPSVEGFKALSLAAEPRRQELLRRLNQPPGATQMLVAMRVDLLRFQRAHPELARTDHDFVHLLRSWFNRGFLVLRQISWETPARILDKIVDYEAVHAIDDLDDLRRRLEPEDRRCFAFFHPSMPDEPLIFVEVALTAEVPGSIDALLSEERAALDPSAARVAVFYSISNCQKGLAGISFGNLLIKQVVSEIAAEVSGVETFVTLSPIPGLVTWLAHMDIAPAHLSPDEYAQQAARYLLEAKRGDGLPRDPVARFHLGNGAEIHDIHAGADLSEKGVAQSGGAMVNYLYDLSRTERHHEDFASQGNVTASRKVQALAASAQRTISEEELT
ncbi:malonyl-CoA decarboxylase domain-containing protein [Roseobacteraceae bacterium S113]